MTISCSLCGEEWPRDPALEVSCPSCKSRVGRHCVRPSGHKCDVHAARDQSAMLAGFLSPCKGARAMQMTGRGAQIAEQASLF